MSYGLQIINPNGEQVIDLDTANLFEVSRHYIKMRDPGPIYEPRFDSNQGEIVFAPHYTIYSSYNTSYPYNAQTYDSYETAVNYNNSASDNLATNLQFTWDNTAKTLSWYAPPLYAGDTWFGFEPYSNSYFFYSTPNMHVVFMRYQ